MEIQVPDLKQAQQADLQQFGQQPITSEQEEKEQRLMEKILAENTIQEEQGKILGAPESLDRDE